jgi:hypothetical protein
MAPVVAVVAQATRRMATQPGRRQPARSQPLEATTACTTAVRAEMVQVEQAPQLAIQGLVLGAVVVAPKPNLAALPAATAQRVKLSFLGLCSPAMW